MRYPCGSDGQTCRLPNVQYGCAQPFSTNSSIGVLEVLVGRYLSIPKDYAKLDAIS